MISRLLAPKRKHGTLANILVGLETLTLIVAAVLFVATDGALFTGNGSLGYLVVVGVLFLIWLAILVTATCDVVHEHRAKRRRNPPSS